MRGRSAAVAVMVGVPHRMMTRIQRATASPATPRKRFGHLPLNQLFLVKMEKYVLLDQALAQQAPRVA